MKCGIVGLPNVGKSKLFNALTSTARAQASNYPFCTIDPNIGTVAVPDKRLEVLAEKTKASRIIPADLTFVDIAGLVKGASKGEGLGNQFLSHIRQVDAILHVVRCFEGDIIHVEGRVNPVEDIDIIETELMLADLQSVEQRLAKKKGDLFSPLLKKAYDVLCQGEFASTASWEKQDKEQQLGLLTLKPMIYVCNTEEEKEKSLHFVEKVNKKAEEHGRPCLTLCHHLEAELAAFSAEEKRAFLQTLGWQEPGIDQVIRTSYAMLGLITFFTAGPKEVRAWTIANGTSAAEAAGVIHTDFQRGFIRAEIISYNDYVLYGNSGRAKEEGKMRSEGKDYIVQDGDVILFRFNV